MNKLTKIIILSILPISQAFAIVVTSASIAASAGAASARSHEIQNQIAQQHMNAINQLKNEGVKGVFICDSGQGTERGYYAKQFDKCSFWNLEHGYYSLPLDKVPENFFPNHEVVNVFFNSYENQFVFYYR